MSEPIEELRERLQRESAESDAKLRQFIREGLTEERLREDWDHLRGASRLKAQPERKHNAWQELLSAIWTVREKLLERLRRFSLRVALPVVALVVVSLLLVTTMSPSGFVAPADPGDRAFTPGQPALPDHVRVDFKKGRIEFFGDGDSLAGTMTASPADSTPEIATFQVAVKGKDSTGLAGEFAGKVFFTRSVPGKIPANKGDIKKIAAEGELRVTGAGPYQVKRSYLP